MTRRVQVGNGQYVAVLFVIPVIVDIHGHRFKVFTLVSEIHDNVDLVLGMKNVFELEGVIETWDSSFKFFNRSLPFFSKEQVVVEPKERKFIKIEALFVDEISGHAIVKMLDNKEQCTVVLKLKFIRNQASLAVTNSMQEKVIFEPRQMLGILDLSVMYGIAGLLVLLGLSRGIVSCIYLFVSLSDALQYTMLIFGFPSLCTLRQY